MDKSHMTKHHNDRVDALAYMIDGLRIERARREKRHRLIMAILVIGAILADVFFADIMK